MTIVEFYSSNAIENVVSTLANRPELVIFIGEPGYRKRCEKRFKRFCQAAGIGKIRMLYKSLEHPRILSDIINVLDDIYREYPDCQFDLNGGNDLCLVAAGVIFERYRAQGVDLHQYNIRTGEVYDCDMDGDSVSKNISPLTAEQNIILHGGSIVPYTERESGHYPWNFDMDFCNDIRSMWSICRSDCALWNTQITILGDMQSFAETRRNEAKQQTGAIAQLIAACGPVGSAAAQPSGASGGSADDILTLNISLKDFEYYLSAKRERTLPSDFGPNSRVLASLEKAGMISDIRRDPDSFHVTFKNLQVKHCLSKAGTLLEVYTCLVAKNLKDDNGTPYYQDVMAGVFIDWDGIPHEKGKDEPVDTENEIDVVLMRGLVPVFISCKNGQVDDSELYKLKTVSNQFGGTYVVRVLAGTTLGSRYYLKDDTRTPLNIRYLYERARDMKIQVIPGIHEMTEEEFGQMLKKLA